MKKKSIQRPKKTLSRPVSDPEYARVLKDVVTLLESARQASARAINSVMTTTYWQIGRRIVQVEQSGKSRAGYGEQIMSRLSGDLTARFGRGFGRSNLFQMRAFYLTFQKIQTPSGQLGSQFPLPWSHYVRLLSVENKQGREFYLTEALRGGWSYRQLDRQISSQFFERTALSRNKLAMLSKGVRAVSTDQVSPEEEIKDPFVLEFLGLKDEYSESELEEALIHHLESFLMELGGDFAFVGRQRRLRIGDSWFRVDLVFFHRKLRCLIIVDLKIGAFTHADAGQMHLYLNYAKRHWTHPGENPPVGLILCAAKDEVLAKYALEGLPNSVMASQYRTTLPREKELIAEMTKTRSLLEHRHKRRP